jgi:hypothetical protein
MLEGAQKQQGSATKADSKHVEVDISTLVRSAMHADKNCDACMDGDSSGESRVSACGRHKAECCPFCTAASGPEPQWCIERGRLPDSRLRGVRVGSMC